MIYLAQYERKRRGRLRSIRSRWNDMWGDRSGQWNGRHEGKAGNKIW